MTGRYLILTLLGASFGAGIALMADTVLVRGARASRQLENADAGPTTAPHRPAFNPRRLALPAAAGGAAWALTGWPVPALLAACAAYFLPGLMMGSDRTHEAHMARIDAVASWAELMRDTLSASAGLLEAIRATAPFAPDAILPAASRLVERLGRDPQAALRTFADEVADPIADRVVIALGFAVANPARDLAGLLGALAATAREQAAMNTRIQIARARTRTAVRVITAVTLGLGAALALLDRSFLAPYGTGFGQLALLIIGGLFAAGFAWLSRLSQLPDPPRLLQPSPSVPAQRRNSAERSSIEPTATSVAAAGGH